MTKELELTLHLLHPFQNLTSALRSLDTLEESVSTSDEIASKNSSKLTRLHIQLTVFSLLICNESTIRSRFSTALAFHYMNVAPRNGSLRTY